jgi:hypothetical protein
MTLGDIARTLGRRGGRARARRLSATERRRIAALGGQARRQSLQVARRIADNFAYVATMNQLQPRTAQVVGLARFEGPLPGIYRGGRKDARRRESS